MGPIVDEHPLPGFNAQPGRSAKRKRWWVRVTAVLLILLTLAWARFFEPSWVRLFDQPITFWDDEPGYTRYISYERDWTLRFPETWHAIHIANYGQKLGMYQSVTRGVFISNMKMDEREVWTEGMPAGIVAVRVVADFPGGILFDQFCNHDIKLPIQLSNAASSNALVRDAAGGTVRAFWHPFAIRGIGVYSIRVWSGSEASARDRASAEAIVGSIRYPTNVGLEGIFNGCPIEDKLKRFGGKVS